MTLVMGLLDGKRMDKIDFKKIVVALFMIVISIVALQSFHVGNVVSAQKTIEIELAELQGRYQKLNDELWEIKNSRDTLNNKINEIELQLQELRNVKVTTQKTTQEATQEKKGVLSVITCYDLSEDSNGTWKGHKWYGLTANGFDLRGHTWESARTVAVDKSIYPLGTKLKLTFVGEKYQKYNGIYTARDTGGAIKGNKIDLFLGDFNQRRTHSSVWDFGKTKAYVEVVK